MLDTATNRFGNMDAAELKASLTRFEGVCVFATVNPDGTPNAAIFVPVMPDEEHLAVAMAPNHTRENLKRTGVAHVVYDVADPKAADKADRHRGARLAVSLLSPDGPDAAEYERVASAYARMNPATLILRIDEIMPVG